MNDITYTIAHSIQEIDSAVWDAIVGDELRMTHRWLRVMEACWQHYEPLYLLFCDRQGGLAVAVVDGNDAITGSARFVGQFLKRATFVVNPPNASAAYGVLARPGVALTTILPQVMPVLESMMWRGKRPLLVMRNIKQADIPAWQEQGFVLSAQEGTAVLDLPSDYDQYFNSLSSKNRSELRRNQRRAAEQQVTLEQGSLSEDGALVYPLFREVYARFDEPTPFTAEFFSTIAREMPGQALLFKGFVGGKLAGASLYLTNGQRAWWPSVGLNYKLAYPSYLYFLLMDEMIQWAIQHGVKRFYGGTTKEREKSKHGFVIQERWFGYHAAPSLLNSLLRFALPAAQKVF